jgi:hypothetical protein
MVGIYWMGRKFVHSKEELSLISRLYLVKIGFCIITFLIVIAINEEWIIGNTVKIIGTSQIILIEIPDCGFTIGFSSLMRRYSNKDIGGTFVSLLDCIYYLGN